MHDIFNGENSNLSTLTIFLLAYAGFLRYIEVSVPKRYDVNIEDTYMRLLLGQSKTNSYTLYRSGQWICIIS